MLLVAEASVSAVADRLPEPREWSSPELDVKDDAVLSLEQQGGAGVVFVGSSNMDVAAYPPTLPPVGGRPAYNAAVGAGDLTMIDTWATRFVVPHLHPDVVVVGLSSRELNPNDPAQTRHRIDFLASPAVEHLLGTESILQRIGRRAADVSRVVEHRATLRQPARVYEALRGRELRTGEFGEVVSPSGQYQGFLHAQFVASPAATEALRSAGLHDFVIGDERVALARHLLTTLTGQGIRVIVVNMPMTRTFVDAHPRGQADYDEATATIRREAEDAGATFVDLGVWPDDLFADAVHLNGRGSARFMVEIASTVAEVAGS
jgi:hypothetical protein